VSEFERIERKGACVIDNFWSGSCVFGEKGCVATHVEPTNPIFDPTREEVEAAAGELAMDGFPRVAAFLREIAHGRWTLSEDERWKADHAKG